MDELRLRVNGSARPRRYTTFRGKFSSEYGGDSILRNHGWESDAISKAWDELASKLLDERIEALARLIKAYRKLTDGGIADD